MHEASIVACMIGELTDRIDDGRLEGRVSAVYIRVGGLTAAIPASLRLFFDVLKRETALEDARLEIEEVPVACECRSCGTRFEIHHPSFRCARCRSLDVVVVTGRELVIQAVEVES